MLRRELELVRLPEANSDDLMAQLQVQRDHILYLKKDNEYLTNEIIKMKKEKEKKQQKT